jgi:hypothetical protein
VTADERPLAERRTQALRGPGAGGFTPPQSLAASNPCLNCGMNIQLEFCPECGQRAIDPDPALREFLHEAAEEFLHWDGKLASTFRLLVTKPGALTKEYLAGRRVRYISPLRLYLTCSVLYFFCAALIPSRSAVFTRKLDRAAGAQAGPVDADSTDTAAGLAEVDSLAHARMGRKGALAAHFSRALRDRKELSRRVTAAMPNAMFLLLPISAALFALGFRDRRRRYPQHLTFALHVHAMLFLALTVLLVARLTTNAVLDAALTTVCCGAMGAYLIFAANRVYGGSRGGVLARLMLVFGSYFIAFAFTMLAVLFIIVLRF